MRRGVDVVLGISDDLVKEIFCEWLHVKDTALFDTALCNKTSRSLIRRALAGTCIKSSLASSNYIISSEKRLDEMVDWFLTRQITPEIIQMENVKQWYMTLNTLEFAADCEQFFRGIKSLVVRLRPENGGFFRHDDSSTIYAFTKIMKRLPNVTSLEFPNIDTIEDALLTLSTASPKLTTLIVANAWTTLPTLNYLLKLEVIGSWTLQREDLLSFETIFLEAEQFPLLEVCTYPEAFLSTFINIYHNINYHNQFLLGIIPYITLQEILQAQYDCNLANLLNQYDSLLVYNA